MAKTQGKIKSLTIQEKLDLIEVVENGEKTLKEVSEELKINRNTLHYILKNKVKIRNEIIKKPVSNQSLLIFNSS